MAHKWTRQTSVGDNSLDASSILDVNSTIKGSRPYPRMTEAQRDLIATPAQSLTIFNTDTEELNIYNGTTWQAVGSGAGGGGGGAKNYISEANSLFEGGIADWFLYDDGGAGDYVDGTGGIPGLLIDDTTVVGEVLEGGTSLKISKQAGFFHAGEGASVETTAIDRADQGKTLFANMSVDFSNATGEHFEVRAYDITNSEILYTGPEEARAIPASKGLISVPVYLNSDTALVRLSIHCKDNNTDAYDVFIDEVTLGPSGVSLADPTQEWEAFTPTGDWTTNTTYTGFKKLVGDTLHVQMKLALSGAPNSSTLNVNLPDGFTIDTNKTHGDFDDGSVGIIHFIDQGSNYYLGRVRYNTTTNLRCTYHTATSNSNNVNETAPFTFANTDEVYIRYSIPVVEQRQATILNENQLALQTAKFIGSAPNTVYAASSFLQLTGIVSERDTAKGFSSDSYIIPNSGYYRIRGEARPTGGTGTTNSELYISVDGVRTYEKVNASQPIGVEIEVGVYDFFSKGQVITFEVRHFFTGTTTLTNQRFTIEESPDLTLYGAVRHPKQLYDINITGNNSWSTTTAKASAEKVGDKWQMTFVVEGTSTSTTTLDLTFTEITLDPDFSRQAVVAVGAITSTATNTAQFRQATGALEIRGTASTSWYVSGTILLDSQPTFIP